MTNPPIQLPQLAGDLFLTDGGLETTLIYEYGLELPCFAAFHLLRSRAGTEALRRYFETYVGVAGDLGRGIVLETPTWRANPDWASRLGYTSDDLAEASYAAVELVEGVRKEARNVPIVVSGCVGPRGDGYVVDAAMSIEQARRYHGEQIGSLAETAADMIGAITMTYPEEAAGIALAAEELGLPVAISFTVETDGRLPSGHALGDAITAVDDATDGYPAYFMINCAHPTHFARALDPTAAWTQRIRGLRANASTMSHAELDVATELDSGDPEDLGARYAALRRKLPGLAVLGGCCGTDHRHIEAIGRACARRAA